MLNGLTLVNLPPISTATSQGAPYPRDCFLLKTCQRTLIMGMGDSPIKELRQLLEQDEENAIVLRDLSAYRYALETTCGLKSKVPAESEVAGQFKEAYREYLQKDNKNPLIISLLESLFKDAKNIRSLHLNGIRAESYAGIVRKILPSPPPLSERLLIKGSGTMAEDLIKLLKKYFRIYVSARNIERVADISNKYGVYPLNWGDTSMYLEFKYIINTVGAEEILFAEDFFTQLREQQEKPMYIDMGEPSTIATALCRQEGVWRLDDIFEMGSKIGEEAASKIAQAQKSITELLEHRQRNFSINYPFGWEELSFA